MTDIRPTANGASDPMLATRETEVAILRDELAQSHAQIAALLERAQQAEQSEAWHRGRFRDMLAEYERITRERDQARALVQEISDQAPVWESGP